MNLTCNDRERVFLDGTAEEWTALEQHAARAPGDEREQEHQLDVLQDRHRRAPVQLSGKCGDREPDRPASHNDRRMAHGGPRQLRRGNKPVGRKTGV